MALLEQTLQSLQCPASTPKIKECHFTPDKSQSLGTDLTICAAGYVWLWENRHMKKKSKELRLRL